VPLAVVVVLLLMVIGLLVFLIIDTKKTMIRQKKNGLTPPSSPVKDPRFKQTIGSISSRESGRNVNLEEEQESAKKLT